jgi:solute carrier family 25 citrate transporter 1
MQLNKDHAKMGVINVFKHTVQTNGFLGLYKGYSALLLFSVPKNYVRFSGFTFAQTNMFTKNDRMSTLMCGLFAGAAESTFVVTPQETLKTKLVHDKMQENHKYRNLFHGISCIVKENGLGGLYKGYTATLLKQSSNQGIRFLVFNDTSKIVR